MIQTLTFKTRCKLIWEILTIRSFHGHHVSEKALSTFLNGYDYGFKDGKSDNEH